METSTDSHLSQESKLLTTLLTQDYGRTIDNLRVQRLMGINKKDGKVTKESIPSLPDRSIFSCERYQFFLDAPFWIANHCCGVMKKSPAHRYHKDTGRNAITAQMASESRLRAQQWINNGCNGFELKYPISNPMSFWFDQDVLIYLKMNNLKPCQVYGEIVSDDEVTGQMNLNDILGTEIFDLGRQTLETTGCKRTGCFTCGFGIHHENTKEKSRIQSIIDFSNPKLADWMLRGGHFRESDGMWEPYQGLGYWFVLTWISKYGGFDIWFPNKEYYIEKYSTPETDFYLKGDDA